MTKRDSSSRAGKNARALGPAKPVKVDAPLAGDAEAWSYAHALESLDRRINVERSRPTAISPEVWKLDRMGALLDALGNPQKDVRCVHVAGSKGKGSVVEMTAAALDGCGYTTGIFTSPHLVDLRERIRVGPSMIAEADFARLCQRVDAAGKSISTPHGEPTYFEFLTAVALAHFAEVAVDLAVIEVGLGGRLDATNLVQPEVTAISAIQLEHTQILGDTHAKIAREKAGILKPGIPAITIPQHEGAMRAIREVAASTGAPLQVLGEEIEFSSRFEHSPEHGHHSEVSLTLGRTSFEHIVVPLKGEHQALNCGLALAILAKLRERGRDVPALKVAQGLLRTPRHGRLERVSTSPRVIIDGAHTPDSVRALVKTLGTHVGNDSMVVVFGCASDKDIPGMVAAIAQGADKIIFTKATGNPRSAEPRELARKYFEITGRQGIVAPTFQEAMRRAQQGAGREDLICVTGSFYLAGEAKRWGAGRA
jgi:dihydrofolate synthase/folylpolyglutamate synthase